MEEIIRQCAKCKGDVVLKKTKSGEKIECEAEMVNFLLVPGGDCHFIDHTEHKVQGIKMSGDLPQGTPLNSGYLLHSCVCPKAKKF